MKGSVGPFVPIGLAVLATAAFGAYVNRSKAVSTTTEYRPIQRWKTLEVKLEQSGIDEPRLKDQSKFFSNWEPSAAWIRYQVLADGEPNALAGELVRVSVRDENGNPWPVTPLRSPAGNFACVPATHPFKPKKLIFELRQRNLKMAEWPVTMVGEPRLAPKPRNSIRELARDHPGYAPIFAVAERKGTGFTGVAIENDVIDEYTRVRLRPFPSGGGWVVPTHFLKHIDWTPISVHRSWPPKTSQQTITVDGLRIVERDGKRFGLVGESIHVRLKDGAVVTLKHYDLPERMGGFVVQAEKPGHFVSVTAVTGTELIDPEQTSLYAFNAPPTGSTMSATLTLTLRTTKHQSTDYWVPFDVGKAAAK